MVWSVDKVLGGTLISANPVLSKDEKKLFVCHGNSLRIYNTEDNSIQSLLVGHKGRVIGCFLNPFSEFQLYSYADDGEIRLWDIQDCGCVKVVSIPECVQIIEAVIHPTLPNTLFATIVYNGTNNNAKWRLIQFNIQTGVVERILENTTPAVHIAARAINPYFEYNPKKKYDCGAFVALVHLKSLCIYNSVTKEVRVFQHALTLCSVAIHPNKNMVLTGNMEGHLDRWNVLQKCETPKEMVEKRDTADRQGVILPEEEKEVSVVDDPHPILSATLKWHAHPLRTLCVCQHSNLVITGGEEGVIVLWYLNNQQQGFIPRVCDRIVHMCCNGEATKVYVCGSDNSIRCVETTQKVIKSKIGGLGLGGVPTHRLLDAFVRNGLVFDFKSQSIIVSLPSRVGLLQCYDSAKDADCGLIGEMRSETSKAQKEDVLGRRRIDISKMSFSYEWLYVVERWTNVNGNESIVLKMYKRNVLNTWEVYSQIDHPHHRMISCLAINPVKNEIITADYSGDIKIWGLVPRNSANDSNESYNYSSGEMVWSCMHQFHYSDDPIHCIEYSSDGTLFCVSHGLSLTLWDSSTYRLSTLLSAPPPNYYITQFQFFHNSSLMLVVTDRSFYVLDILSQQVVWSLAATVHAAAVNRYNVRDKPYFAVSVKNSETADVLMLFTPLSPIPVFSIDMNTSIPALCWGKESIQEGRRLCLFCLTEKREIIKIAEGEKVEATHMEEESGEKENAVDAYSEVFNVDQIEARNERMKQSTDYQDVLKNREFYGMVNGPTHTLPPPSVLFQSLFDKLTNDSSV